MDSLLRYILVEITITVLLIELAIMAVCCLGIILIKTGTKWNANRTKHIQDKISKIIETALFNKEPIQNFQIPPNLRNFRFLVEVLEKFDQRFTDERWLEIRRKTVNDYLLAQVDKYASSRSWFKRQLAARALLLYPEKASENHLRKLLNDSRYLVRVVAAVCITQTPFQNLFYDMIRRMSKETQLSQFSYRDALMQVSQEKFEWMELLLATDQDPAISAICLDLLSTRYSNNLFTLIKPFVKVENRQCRILAIKALGNCPTEEAIGLLIDHLSDSDWEIRAESIIGLKKLYAVQSIPKLQTMLNDPIWWVRLQAALALKNFGVEGRAVLSNQDQALSPLAYEIAQYTLALPG